MTAEQKAIVKQYGNKVSSIYRDLESLRKLMDKPEFKALIEAGNDDACEDDDLIEKIGMIYGDFDTFVRDLPNAVC